ncbi:amidohydrolase family protein [Rhodoblastus acidophilus]|uniref:Amidohydrolase family protein n=2 Tax=Rhodoblastus acidophilus TaxID=1074 RepID=A0A6N8DS12_RHOAC|nr:amidohydrolase family protein [Rhodoblastus acidophilus]
MCMMCNPAFSGAFKGLSYKSRRTFLRGAAVAAAGAFVAEAVGPALADGALNETLASGLGAPIAKIFVAKKIITMERENPTATAVAIAGNRIVAVGSLDQVKAALGERPFRIDKTFADKVLTPGLIDQHLHPILGALTLAVEVIAPEDWPMPGKFNKAALTPEDYRARLKAAETALKSPNEWLLTWGYQPLWHGKLTRADLNAISKTRPISVWHRSCHEFFLNDAAIAALGLTEAATKGKGEWSEQVNFNEGHYWEGGLNFMMAPMLKVLATPERLGFGLRQMVTYLHANGVTAYNEPGALYTPDMWALYQDILGAPSTPIYSTFLADGRGIPDRVGMAKALQATEEQIAVSPAGPGKKLMFFPRQIKLFADGAIISQLMQMKDGYLDGHKGEWIMPPDQLEERARLYWNAGYQLHIHVNGDLGLEVLLNILEKLMAENPRADHRTVIVHFANSTEEQIGRIARLGAIVSANPYYPVGFADKYSETGLGPERANAMVRANSVRKHAIPLSYHSDLPMGPSAPLALASFGVNRVTPSGRVAGPEQRIDVDAALRAVTIEAAYSWRQEDLIGSIAPGKIANFTVLGEDPYAVDPIKLKDIPVWGTVFEGEVHPVPK